MKNLTAVMAILMLIFAGLACSGDETDKANAMVDEANKFIAEGNKNVEEADRKGKEFDKKVEDISSNEEHDKVSDWGKTELLPIYDKMKDNFEKAGEKFSAASKLKVNDKFKEYLDVKAQEFKKRAEYAESLKAIPKTMTDSKDEKEYNEKVKSNVEKAQKLLKEAQELGDKGTKIQNDNPKIFNKN
ncbi:MAG TPA: hypothetical protein VGC97_06930 [Pyrinomonadaceae bacterium]|jgi:hypothetical protein